MVQVLVSRDSLIEALRLRIAFFARLDQSTFYGLSVEAELDRLREIESRV